MAHSIKGTTITLTRGDSLNVTVTIIDQTGNTYEPTTGDSVRFAMKQDYSDKKTLILKEIPINTMTLTIAPEDTKKLSFGNYVYDIELTTASGIVDTFIHKAKFIITEEVE